MTRRTLVRNQEKIDAVREQGSSIIESVTGYYEGLEGTDSMQETACCPEGGAPKHLVSVHDKLPAELKKFNYGCGYPIPDAIQGLTVLDLAGGPGILTYMMSDLVGEQGKVINIDALKKHISMGKGYQDQMKEKLGYARSNVEFIHGTMEDIPRAGIEPGSLDLVVSNCVFNLSPELGAVMDGVFTALKPGGELYFSDVFVDRRLSQELRDDQVLRAECISGALYEDDFRLLLSDFGIHDYRVMDRRPLPIKNEQMLAKVGHANFESVTVRVLNLQGLDDVCQDYGQALQYNGGIPESPNEFVLDDHHKWKKGRTYLVCENTFRMIAETRFREFFTLYGEGNNTHVGRFDCGPTPSPTTDSPTNASTSKKSGCC